MSMNVSNISFGSKFGEQKAAKFGIKAIKDLKIKAPYSHSAEKITPTMEHIMPAKEIEIPGEINKIKNPDEINKILLKILDNPLYRQMEHIFKG